jgi:hypothetical protein
LLAKESFEKGATQMITINITKLEFGTDEVDVGGTLTFSGNYPAGGDTIDWTTVIGFGADNGRVFVVQALPDAGFAAGSTGDTYGYVAGTALNNGKIKINTASNTELAAGAYPARITGDANIYFDFSFPRFE